MPENLSTAGMDYGRAFCVPDDKKTVPFDQLTPDEQACTIRVGDGWEQKTIARLGGVANPVAIPVVERFTLTGHQDNPIGTLTFADGAVTVCFTPQGTQGPNQCQVVGFGHEALDAARAVLQTMGVGNRATG